MSKSGKNSSVSDRLIGAKAMVSRDMVELKLEARLLKEKLKETGNKMSRLSDIMAKKTVGRGGGDEKALDNIRACGMPIYEFRTVKHANRVPVETLRNKKAFNVEDLEPQTVRPGSDLERIRMQHLARTTGKSIVTARKQKAEQDVAKAEAKARRSTRTIFPSVKVPSSMFPQRYQRGELPCSIEHGVKGWYLSWVCPLEALDYDYYLPIFFDGLQCKGNPIEFLAVQGVEDLLYAARGNAEKVIPCIYGIVRPLRNALSKFDTEVLLNTLKAIQQLMQCAKEIGAALMPYSKQFLAPMAAFLDMNKNLGDGIDYAQRKNNDVGEQIRKTLELMEEFGGEGSLKAIKFSIPLYESCMKDAKKGKLQIMGAGVDLHK